MRKDIALTDRKYSELNVRQCGYEVCTPKYSYGPSIRDQYLIHYVVKGKGVLINKDGRHPVNEGQIFIIYPDETTTYTADLKDPWYYIWIGFTGNIAEKLKSLEKPVIDYTDDTFLKMQDADEFTSSREEYLVGLLYVVISHIIDKSEKPSGYEQQIKNFICSNYMTNVKISEIASMIGLDRRYMTRLFKEKTGFTIQDYLINVRLEKAKKYLKQGKSVADSATLSGYSDTFHFSKSFKKHFGISPKEYSQKRTEAMQD